MVAYTTNVGKITDKRSIIIDGYNDKTITVLVPFKNKNAFTLKNITYIKYNINRIFCYVNNCNNCNLTFIPTNLKKVKIMVEPKDSTKLRNIVTKKFKRLF